MKNKTKIDGVQLAVKEWKKKGLRKGRNGTEIGKYVCVYIYMYISNYRYR